jgi:uncharacterized protein (DUF2141 family)
LPPRPLLAALGLAFLCAGTVPAQSNPVQPEASNMLRVFVEGVKTSEGHVRVDVCVKSEFLKECRYGATSPAVAGVTEVDVADLPPGDYAIQAYHDRNDNGEVDRNFLGLPTELVGFSNDAPLRLTGPSFKAASFDYMGGDKTIRLRLRHLHL